MPSRITIEARERLQSAWDSFEPPLPPIEFSDKEAAHIAAAFADQRASQGDRVDDGGGEWLVERLSAATKLARQYRRHGQFSVLVDVEGCGKIRVAAEQEEVAAPIPSTDREVVQALVDVAAERRRQVEKLGWTPEHDDEHRDDKALPRAAACYALAGTGGGNGPFWITHLQTPQQVWPYRWEWKPKDQRTNLVRAAALIVAEIERLDRDALSALKSRGLGS